MDDRDPTSDISTVKWIWDTADCGGHRLLMRIDATCHVDEVTPPRIGVVVVGDVGGGGGTRRDRGGEDRGVLDEGP